MLWVLLRSTSAKAIEPLAVSSVAEPCTSAVSVIAPVAVVEPAVMVGASLTVTTLTVEVIDSVVLSTPVSLVPPLSLTSVSVNTRLPAAGSSRLVFW